MEDEDAVLLQRPVRAHVHGPHVVGDGDDARPDGPDAHHDAEALLGVAHRDEDALALRGQRERLGRADRRLAHAAFAGDEDEALVGERRHAWGRDA